MREEGHHGKRGAKHLETELCLSEPNTLFPTFSFSCPLLEEQMLNKTHNPLSPKARFPSCTHCPNPIRNYRKIHVNATVALLVLGIKVHRKLIFSHEGH